MARIVVVGEKVQDLVLHPEGTIVTTRTDVPEQGADVPCTLLPSGVLHNSSSVFLQRSTPTLLPTTTTTTTTMTTTPLARFHPLQAAKQPHRPQQWDSSGIGNKLCSAKSARKMTKLRNYSFHLAEKKRKRKKGRRKSR